MIEPKEDTVVVKTLSAEYVRMRAKATGAASRRAFAQRQVEVETSLMQEHQANLDLLADAILAAGGKLPAEDEDTPFLDGVRMAS